jgi:aspartyl aminopeptidase
VSSDVKDLLAFLTLSPTPFHAVAQAITRLEAAGFVPIVENESWVGLADRGPGRYYVTRGESALLAFVVPEGRPLDGFRIVGAHTDSPNLRLKPRPEYVKEGYVQLGVEVYGGALLNSWLDRDLGVAGRVFVESEGAVRSRLVRIDRPILRVPQLAIHLDRDISDKGLLRQEHMPPVLALKGDEANEVTSLVAKELGIDASSIVGTELMLFDVVAPVVGGAREEFLFSARLDNLAMSHASITALVRAAPAAENGRSIPLVALFDHEEIGSQSSRGAESAFLPRVMERVVRATGAGADEVHRVIASSLCVSADMAHAVHPNYSERHEARHKPVLNGGPVIKVNAQQRYATSGETAVMFERLCKIADVPFQHYAHRTDLPCGSTIGPITSTLLGIPTVDVGNPMLSMHSIREMAGTKDPERMTRVMTLFFCCASVTSSS